MSVALSTLIPRVKASVNAPGGSFITAEDADWIAALGNAFWAIRIKGFFTEYRLSDNDQAIETIEGDDDMPGEVQQLVVLQCAIAALEGKFAELNTKFRAKDGDSEFETGKTASLLTDILKARRLELAALHEQLVSSPALARYSYACDLVTVRLNSAFVG